MDENDRSCNEVNLADYLSVLVKHKWLIAILVLMSVLTTGIIAFNSPNIYQATAAIIPASQPKERAGMSAIAAQFGISTAPASNVSEITRLLQSNILMEKVLTKHNLMPVFFEKADLEEMTAESKVWKGIRYLKSVFTVNHDQQEGIIELTAESENPKTAAAIINYMLAELTDYMSHEAKRVAGINKKYLESLIDENADPLIGQKIYSLIAKQIEISMMAEVKENFAFKVLDPPKVPDKKIRPKRSKIILLSFIMSFFASVLLAFLIEYAGKIRSQGNQPAVKGHEKILKETEIVTDPHSERTGSV